MALVDGWVEKDAESVKCDDARQSVAEDVRQRLSACPFSHLFSRVNCRLMQETLTVEGSVPTFYLKQMLQSIVRTVESVERISNNVRVVSSSVLSSEQEREP